MRSSNLIRCFLIWAIGFPFAQRRDKASTHKTPLLQGRPRAVRRANGQKVGAVYGCSDDNWLLENPPLFRRTNTDKIRKDSRVIEGISGEIEVALSIIA